MEQPESTISEYPPESGHYFSNHFILGGVCFENSQPEAYLLGENNDLDFLKGQQTQFPYTAPQPNIPSGTLKSLMHIRKASLKLVRLPESSTTTTSKNPAVETSYNVEFLFDSDVKCAITIYYFCTEEVTANGVIYTPRDPTISSETYYYNKGSKQQFSQPSHFIDPSKFPEDMLNYKIEDGVIPVLIQCSAEEGKEPRQSHMLIATIEKHYDGSYRLKPLRQKIYIDGVCYLLQEIYGLEKKKSKTISKVTGKVAEESGSECVICMSEPRDTLIFPCRHLCICNICASGLQGKANTCPLCRIPYHALLQIKAVRKSKKSRKSNPQVSHNTENQQHPSDFAIPPGYEAVSLIDALNGPLKTLAPLSLVHTPDPPCANSPDI